MIPRPQPIKLGIALQFFLFIFIAMTIGCGPSNHVLRPEKITPEQINLVKTHQGNVLLMVDGGWEEAILALQLMPNSAVKAALEAAVEESRLFENITAEGSADYCLAAFIYDIDQPLMGGTGTVAVEMAWSLTNLRTDTLIWRESIETTHTASPKTMMSLREKSNLAAETATKENIKIAIERISELQL